MNKKITTFLIAVILLSPATAMAASFVVNVINNFLSMIVWPVFVGLVVIMFIWAGILYLTARGEPGKIHTANLTVVFAIVGIIVAIIGYKAVGTITNLIPSAPIPTGACSGASVGSSGCSIETQNDCIALGGIYGGDNSTCP